MRQNFPIAAAFGEPGFAETDAQIADYVAQQRERPYGSFDGGINGGYAKRTSRSVINTTSLSFGDLTVRNIFGYRKNFTSQLINTGAVGRSEEHTSELQSLMRISYAVFCLKKQNDEQGLRLQ